MLKSLKSIPLLRWLILLGLMVLFGIAGFMILEGYSLFDALYMVVITITSIGYQEVKPLSTTGRAFNMVLIITSFTAFTLALARLTHYIVSGEMTSYFKNRRLMQAVDQMNNHVIVCGFGRNGKQAVKTLIAHKLDFVVIERTMEPIDRWPPEEADLVYILGDATEDETLLRAGIHRARALLLTLPEDADNVFIVLSARSLNTQMQIISRASSHGAIAKLYKAGANNVIMPDMIGGTHMATLVSKPDVLEFIDFLSGEDGEAIHIESVSYQKLPEAIRDKSLREIMNWKKTGVNCIGIKDQSGKFIINPPDSTIICNGMKVIVLGTLDQISEMKMNVGD